MIKKIILIILALTLALTWVFSIRGIRLKIGNYYYNQRDFDRSVNWYGKIIRRAGLNTYPGKEDLLKYEEVISKLNLALISQARHHLNRINSSIIPSIPDFESFGRTMAEYSKIMQLYENYRRTPMFNVEQITDTLNEILKEIKIKENDTCLAFGEKYIQANMWQGAKYFFTKGILKYLNPIEALEKLDKLYGGNFKLKEKIWGSDIFVTLEDFEDSDKPILTSWVANTEPTINIRTISSGFSRTGNNSEYFDLSYKKPGYDYWTKPVNIPLTNPNLKLGVRLFLKSQLPGKGILKINVSYPKQKVGGVWQTDTRKDIVNGWEERRIENLFQKAQMIASQQNWDMTDMAIERIILDTEGLSSKFYIDDIELFITRN